MSGYSLQVKTVINGDEYYTQQKSVNMILPYVLRGGTKRYGVRLISPKVLLSKPL